MTIMLSVTTGPSCVYAIDATLASAVAKSQ
jgi:hypothetical protein